MTIPANVHVSTHPCLQAKLSQLRSQSTSPRETKSLVHEIANILGVEAFTSGLKPLNTGKVRSITLLLHHLYPLGYTTTGSLVELSS